MLLSTNLYSAVFNPSLRSRPTSYVVYRIDCFCSAHYCPVLACIDQYQYIDWVHSIYSQPFGQNKYKFSHTSCYRTVLLYAHLYCLSIYLGALSFANYYECILQCQYVPILLPACLYFTYRDFKHLKQTIHRRLLYMFHTHHYSMVQLD